MAYATWTVVAGEQPTTVKWNQLGENDERLRDGTAFPDGVFATRHYADGSVTSRKLDVISGTEILAAPVPLAGNDVQHDVVFTEIFTVDADQYCDLQASAYVGGVAGAPMGGGTNISIALFMQEDGNPWENVTPDLQYVVMGNGEYPKQLTARATPAVNQGSEYQFKMIAWSSAGIGNVLKGGNTYLEWEVKRTV